MFIYLQLSSESFGRSKDNNKNVPVPVKFLFVSKTSVRQSATMNSTSFTSIDPNGASNNDKNIDSSSTAHLTLNAAIGTGPQTTRSTNCGNNSDSDLEASPSVTVLRTTGSNSHSNHHHLHHHLPRPSRLLSSGFSFSNRIHLTTKHQRTLWSRATHFEKILLLALLILFTVSLLLFLFLGSVILKQKNELKAIRATNSTTTRVSKVYEQHGLEYNGISSIITSSNETKKFCLTPDCVKVAASVIEAIDLTMDPCDDFYVSFE